MEKFKVAVKLADGGKSFGLKVISHFDKKESERTTRQLKFNKDNEANVTLEKGRHLFMWHFLGNPGATIQVVISDAAGKVVRTFKDTIPANRVSELDVGELEVQ